MRQKSNGTHLILMEFNDGIILFCNSVDQSCFRYL